MPGAYLVFMTRCFAVVPLLIPPLGFSLNLNLNCTLSFGLFSGHPKNFQA